MLHVSEAAPRNEAATPRTLKDCVTKIDCDDQTITKATMATAKAKAGVLPPCSPSLYRPIVGRAAIRSLVYPNINISFISRYSPTVTECGQYPG